MRRRFFVERFSVDQAVMEGEAAHHLGRVLRAQVGQLYELSDGNRVWLARVEEVKRERIGFSLIEELPVYQPALQTTLLLAIVKFDAFELALEKATELGVSSIVPVAAERSEKALVVAAKKRAERWKKLLLEASQQSRRLRLPMLQELVKPETAFSANREGQKILLSERRDAPPLRGILNVPQGTLDVRRPSVLEKNGSKDPPLHETKRGENGSGIDEKPQPKKDPPQHKASGATATGVAVAVAIGPEGGWTERELEVARQFQFLEASLGKLILRTETAVVAALASINYELGE